MGILQTSTDHAHRVAGKCWVPANHFVPGGRWPEQRKAVDDRGGRSRIVFAPKRHRHAEQIAWTDKADDDLLTVWGHLGDTQASMQQQEKRMRRFVLGENGRAFGVMPRMRALQNVIE